MIQWLQSTFILKNLKTGKPSYTLTAFIIGFAVINMKLLFSGIDIMGKFKMSSFSGTDYGVALAALGSLHIANKKVVSDISKSKEEQK